MNLVKKISYGVASLAAAAVVSFAPATAHAQVLAPGYGYGGGYGNDILGTLPGSSLGLGQLFVLDRLFTGDNGGVLGSSRTNGFVYTVQSGDTLKAIAARYLGNSNLYGQIVAANNIPNPNLIYPGQQLVIPTANTTIYGTPNTGVLNSGGNNLGNLFVLGRLFGGNQPLNLGSYLILDQLFNNGAYGSIGGTGVLGTGTSGSSLGDLLVLDQLFGGNTYGSGYGFGGTVPVVPVVPIVPSQPTPVTPAPVSPSTPTPSPTPSDNGGESNNSFSY